MHVSFNFVLMFASSAKFHFLRAVCIPGSVSYRQCLVANKARVIGKKTIVLPDI